MVVLLSGTIQPMPDDYRQLTLPDLEPMAQVLAQSFSEDPLVSFILPNAKTRVHTVGKFFRAMGRLNIRAGSAFGTGYPLAGVAVWSFPNKSSSSASLGDLTAFLPVLFSSYVIGVRRARAILNQIEANHKKHALESHFYLDNLGVIEAARGKGLSSKLIRPFLQMADEQKVVAYTDTVTGSNVPVYEHFGFECVERNLVEGTGITVYALRRPVHS
ncbi:MAG TPA: GNAT family N-acetyltransferase [Anaerolineales bacterium]|nr:GNAT family N-acetyltransferase [Anaerolineales bacterium]